MNTFFDGLEFSLSYSEHHHREEIHHEPTYYGFQFNYSGGMFLRIDHGELFQVEGPYVFITHPGAFFEYGNWKTPVRSHNFLCCFGPRIERYLETGLLPLDDKKPLIRILRPEKMLEIFSEIIVSLKRSRGMKTPARAVLLYEELLLMLHEDGGDANPVPSHRRAEILALMEEIRRAPEKKYSFDRFAASRGMELEYFRRLFKALSGLPPVQFHIRCRMCMASELLFKTDLPIKEISRACGMENEYYFSRLFRKQFHTAPGRYRKEMPEWKKEDRFPGSDFQEK